MNLGTNITFPADHRDLVGEPSPLRGLTARVVADHDHGGYTGADLVVELLTTPEDLAARYADTLWANHGLRFADGAAAAYVAEEHNHEGYFIQTDLITPDRLIASISSSSIIITPNR